MTPTEHFATAEDCAERARACLDEDDLGQAAVLTSLGALHAQLAHVQTAAAMAGLAQAYEVVLRREAEQQPVEAESTEETS